MYTTIKFNAYNGDMQKHEVRARAEWHYDNDDRRMFLMFIEIDEIDGPNPDSLNLSELLDEANELAEAPTLSEYQDERSVEFFEDN